MKKIIALILALIFALGLVGCGQGNSTDATVFPSSETTATTNTAVASQENPVIRLSTTTSVNDSGLLPYLQPFFEKDSGYTLEITSAGTGAAIEKGRTGDADCLLVHAKSSEEEFISEGFATERVPFMYNYFVIVGPTDDPAGVANCTTAVETLQAIAENQSTFISRGDDSGTNKAELKIWAAAGIEPSGDWYVSAGQGMGACITMAVEEQAYILTDKATYLSHEQRGELNVLMSESDDLKNTYSMLAISPDKWSDTNYEGAMAFIKWMTSDKAAELIRQYGVEEYGESLFFVAE